MVLADGRVVQADRDNHSDLFLALKGGSSNFGVVTKFCLMFLLLQVAENGRFGDLRRPTDCCCSPDRCSVADSAASRLVVMVLGAKLAAAHPRFVLQDAALIGF